MKKISILILIMLIQTSLLALKIEDNNIVDQRGNKIEKKIYKKIVILDPAAVEVLYLLGGEDNIVAIGTTARSPIWPEEKTKKLPGVGSITKPSIEQILTYQPDLVILNAMSENIISSLKERKLNYIMGIGSSFEEILQNLEVYGIIIGKDIEAKELSEEYRNKLSIIKNKIEKNKENKKGVFIYSTSPMMVFNSSSLPGEILKTLGIKNIADGIVGGRPILSPEYLITENPDFIAGAMSIKTKDDILNSNPFVKETKAGKTGAIFILDSNKILRPTPRVIDALEELEAEILKFNK